MPYPNPPLNYLGRHRENDVFYFSVGFHELDSLPKENWVCLGIANQDFDRNFFEEFVIYSAVSGLLEFKGQGKYGELLHDLFDENILEYELEEEVETDIMTTWHNDKPNDLANNFWGCFYANVLPDEIDSSKTKVVCVAFDKEDYTGILKDLLVKLNQGWIPPDEDYQRND